MRLRRAALVIAALAGPIADGAWADGTEVSGVGFRVHAPSSFQLVSKEEHASDWVHQFSLDVPDAGAVVLTVESHLEDDADLARTKMAFAKSLDMATAKAEVSGSEPRGMTMRVAGAEEAYEVVAIGFVGTWRTLSARAGALRVSVTLKAPAAAEKEAQEAWKLASESLRVEEPSIRAGSIVLWVLGFLIVAAVLVRLAKWRPRVSVRPKPAPAPAADPAIEKLLASAGPAPAPPASSRAEDGLPLFTPDAKAAAVVPEVDPRLVITERPPDAPLLRADEEWRPLPAPRAPSPPAPAPSPEKPKRAPEPVPPRRAVRIVKGYNGAPSP